MIIDIYNAPHEMIVELKAKHYFMSSYEVRENDPIVRAVRELLIKEGYDIRHARVTDHCYELAIEEVVSGQLVMEIIYSHQVYLRKDFVSDKKLSQQNLLKDTIIKEIRMTRKYNAGESRHIMEMFRVEMEYERQQLLKQ